MQNTDTGKLHRKPAARTNENKMIEIKQHNSGAVMCGIIAIITLSLSGSLWIAIIADPDSWTYLIANVLFWDILFVLFAGFTLFTLLTVYAFCMMTWYEGAFRDLSYARESDDTLIAMELRAMAILSRDMYEELQNRRSRDSGSHPSRWRKSEDTLVNVDLGEIDRTGIDADELTDLLEEEAEN